MNHDLQPKTDLHHWTPNDFKIIFFIVKYGLTPIYFKNETEVSTFIGTTVTSVKKMCSNFRHLLGLPNQLDHIKNLQQAIFDEYKDKSFMDFWNECKTLVNDYKVSKILLSKGVKNYRKVETV